MAAEPFPLHHIAGDLEASTAITSVTSAAMEHAAKQAAELVDEAAHKTQTGSSKGRRASRRVAEVSQAVPEAAAAAGRGLPEGAAPLAPATDQSLSAAEPAAREDEAAGSPVRSNLDETAAAVEGRVSQPAETLARLNAKAAEAMRTNIDAAFAFWAAMMSAKSASEAATLNAQHWRKQIETLTTQSRELSTLAQQLAIESLGQVKTPRDEPKQG